MEIAIVVLFGMEISILVLFAIIFYQEIRIKKLLHRKEVIIDAADNHMKLLKLRIKVLERNQS